MTLPNEVVGCLGKIVGDKNSVPMCLIATNHEMAVTKHHANKLCQDQAKCTCTDRDTGGTNATGKASNATFDEAHGCCIPDNNYSACLVWTGKGQMPFPTQPEKTKCI